VIDRRIVTRFKTQYPLAVIEDLPVESEADADADGATLSDSRRKPAVHPAAAVRHRR
jgi:hypothetical protein